MKRIVFLLALSMAFTSLRAQLSGTYTINSNASQNPDYTSFSAAATALAAGVSGQVVFEVAPGTYEEYVTLNNINGTSATSRVIFRGMGADNQQVVVTSNAGYTDNSTLKLAGTDYVTFENMTLTTTSDNKAVVVKLQNGNSGLRFENVRFVGSVSSANLENDKNLVYRISGEWLDSDNAFVDCAFVNGYIGLYYQGHNIYQYNDGLLVENCTFTNQSSKSVYVTFTDHVTVSGNTINSTYDIRNDYNAIDIFRCRYGCLFENNVIDVTRTTNYTTVFRLRPVTGTAAEPVIIRNNIVNLQCNADYSYCFDFDNADSEHIYFAHNTAKCSGSGLCGNLFVEKSWENLWVYNNLFVNETSGYVFRFNSDSDNRFCDYNRVSFTGSNVGIIAGTDCATLADWTAASGFDAHSALCTPQFVGNNDLHITDSDGITVANPLSYVTTDIDGEDRSTTPCAGADEYASGTNLPPVVVNPINDIVFETYPASETVDLTDTFDDPDDPNEDIVITVASNSNPTLVGTTLNGRTLEVERLQNMAGTSVIVLQAESNGQSVQTSFTVECIVEDQPPVVSNQLAPIIYTEYPQSFTFDISACFDDPDNNNEMMEYTVQVCPSEVSASIDDEDVLTVSRTTPNAFNDRILVIRATSNGKHVDMEVSVSGVEVVITVDIADFEDVELSPSGIWEPQEGNNEMFSHGWIFTNYYSSYFWGGFTASNRTDLSQTYMSAQYTAATGCGYDGSAQYAVAYTYGAQTDVYAADGQSHTVTGCYVTNNLWAYQNMLEGDNTVTPFGGLSGNDPDWFKLTATGKNASGQTVGTLDFYLADYRFDNPEDDYILNTWEWFDLSPLGEVATISFSLSSTKNNNSGMITPAYFCMDDFNGGAVVDLPPYIVHPVPDVIMTEFPKLVYIDLNGVATDPDDPDELIEYELISNSNEEALSASLSGRILALNRLTSDEAIANVLMRAISDGQSVDFIVHVIMHQVEGLEEDHYGLRAYPNPTDGRLTLTMEGASGFDYHVFSLMGQCIMNGKVTGNETTLDLGHLNKGVYYISIEWNSNRLIKKVIVK